jgi:hypothetical protein
VADDNLGSLGDAFVSIKADFTELKNEFGAAFGEIGKMLGELEASGASIASGIATGFAVMVGAGVAAAAAVAGITAEIISFGDEGAKVDDVTKSFDAFAQGLGIAGGTALQNLRTGTAGLVDDFTLMKDTTKAMSAGLKLTADDFTLVGEASRIMAKQAGVETKQAFEDLTNALDSGMTKALLRNYGVVSDVKGANADLKDTLRQLNEETTTGADIDAKRGAIMDALRLIVEKTGNQSLDFGEKITVAKVSFTNFTDQLSVAIARSPALNAALDTIESSIAKAFGEDSKQSIATIVSYVDKFAIFVAGAAETAVTGAKFIVEAWDGIKILFDYLLIGLLSVSEGVSKVVATIADVADKVPGMGDKFKGLGAVFQQNADLAEQQRQILIKSANDNLDSASKHIQAFDGMHDAIDKVRAKMIEAAAAGDVQEDATKRVTAATGDAKDKSDAHAQTILDVTKKLTDLNASLLDAERNHLTLTDIEKIHGGEIADLTLKAKEFGLSMPDAIAYWSEAITNSKVEQTTLDTMVKVQDAVAKGFEGAAQLAASSLGKLNANQKTLVTTATDVQAQIVAATQVGADAQLALVDARLTKEIEKLGPLPDAYATAYNAARDAIVAAQKSAEDAIDARVTAELNKIANTEYASEEARTAETRKVNDEAAAQKTTIDGKFANEITKLGLVPAAYADAHGKATDAVQTNAQIQRDLINGTADTLIRRMSDAGVKTKDALDSIADRAKSDFDQMKESGEFTSGELIAQWQKYEKDAGEAVGGFKGAWDSFLGDASANGEKLINGLIGGWQSFKSAAKQVLDDFISYFEKAVVQKLLAWALDVSGGWGKAFTDITKTVSEDAVVVDTAATTAEATSATSSAAIASDGAAAVSVWASVATGIGAAILAWELYKSKGTGDPEQANIADQRKEADRLFEELVAEGIDPNDPANQPNAWTQYKALYPGLAEGGITFGPMLGLFGEAGPEAVVPLDRYDEMMRGGAPAAAGGGGGVRQTPLAVNVDGRLLTMVVIEHTGEITRLMGVPT